MSNCIYTFCFGEKYKKIQELSLNTLINYSKKCKCDLINIYYYDYELFPHFLKLKILENASKSSYDKILYLDSDILISNKSPNLFELYNNTAIWPHTGKNVEKRIEFLNDHFRLKINNYYNTGVMFFIKEDLIKLNFENENEKKIISTDYEQAYLNFILHKFNIEILPLEEKWNFEPKKTLDKTAYFYHYVMNNKELMLEHSKNEIFKPNFSHYYL